MALEGTILPPMTLFKGSAITTLGGASAAFKSNNFESSNNLAAETTQAAINTH